MSCLNFVGNTDCPKQLGSLDLLEDIGALVEAADDEPAVLVGYKTLRVIFVCNPVVAVCALGGVVLAILVHENELCTLKGGLGGVVLVDVCLIGKDDNLVLGSLAVRGGSAGVVGILEVNIVEVAVIANHGVLVEGRVVVDYEHAVSGNCGNRGQDNDVGVADARRFGKVGNQILVAVIQQTSNFVVFTTLCKDISRCPHTGLRLSGLPQKYC